ncbi:hypothetical protein, partial [Fischerella sp. FACHB-380]|uniref:hypothetical protein n=1 Tax=Fischerella sp. FACHB-380 TaxID=2692799 RepID=UPI001A7E26AF
RCTPWVTTLLLKFSDILMFPQCRLLTFGTSVVVIISKYQKHYKIISMPPLNQWTVNKNLLIDN